MHFSYFSWKVETFRQISCEIKFSWNFITFSLDTFYAPMHTHGTMEWRKTAGARTSRTACSGTEKPHICLWRRAILFFLCVSAPIRTALGQFFHEYCCVYGIVFLFAPPKWNGKVLFFVRGSTAPYGYATIKILKITLLYCFGRLHFAQTHTRTVFTLCVLCVKLYVHTKNYFIRFLSGVCFVLFQIERHRWIPNQFMNNFRKLFLFHY